ncbi:hypothetical protein [Rhabdothermincola salaria]|uniref:hypothetical protein n=1 Tax=Rhabdothermincola salaria TaxID=2903142 RepID=UPI001E65294D|nr:hypothetical protein [Rhabdothermincola salaria]MCD9625009.1 hypothetical protein [Rhabdothermincola salaria]
MVDKVNVLLPAIAVSKYVRVGVVAIGLTGALAGCGSTTDSTATTTTTQAPAATGTSDVVSPPITWGGGGDIGGMEAIIIGDLDSDGHCWGIDLIGDEGRALVAWPKGTQAEGDAVRFPDGSLHRPGDRLEDAGGRVSLDANLASMIGAEAERLQSCRQGETDVVFIN